MQFIDLQKQYQVLKNEIDINIHNVLDSSQYMIGKFVKQLEKELAKYVGVKHCITCANGTDALQLALMAWNIGPGDAVFVPTFTFYSTAEVVSLLGATPIFVDIEQETFNMDTKKLEKAIIEVKEYTRLTPKVVIPVDLFGQPAKYGEIRKIANQYNLYILEDGAQGFGGTICEKKACSFGDISTTSFFPAKPLGCYGDGGALFTDDENLYNLLCSLRIHGKGEFKYDNIRVGMNSRLDEIQAAVLIPKLKAFKNFELESRNKIADFYTEKLSEFVVTPSVLPNYKSSWAQYTILLDSNEEREFILEKMSEHEIPTMVYYPKPLHKQTVYQNYKFNVDDLNVSESVCKKCLSIPMHPYLELEEINYIVDTLILNLKEYRNGE